MNFLKKWLCKRKLKNRYKSLYYETMCIENIVYDNWIDINNKTISFLCFLAQERILFKFLNKLPHKDETRLKRLKNNLKWLNTKATKHEFIFPSTFDWGKGKFWLHINKKWINETKDGINAITRFRVEGIFKDLELYYKHKYNQV